MQVTKLTRKIKINSNKSDINSNKIDNFISGYLLKINVGELKSMSALPTLRQCLNNRPDNLETIIIASAMFEISNHDDGDELANICLEAFKPIEDDINSTYGVYGVIHAFFFLAKFRNPQIRSIIAKYIDHPEVLISANAKSALARIDK